MSGLLQNILGGGSKTPSPAPSSGDDADFADFAGAPEQPVASVAEGTPAGQSFGTDSTPPVGTVPYTKWYRVWERTSPKDFIQEAFVLPFIIVVVLFHVWGTKKNRRKAKAWAQAHIPVLQSEFAVVGYGGVRKTPSVESVQAEGLSQASGSPELVVPESMLKEKSLQEFATYATGRQNVAFVDVSIKLLKRFNPFYIAGDYIFSLFFDSWPFPVEKVEMTAYAFDGKEKDLVPTPAAVEKEALEQRSKGNSSTYDGFVFAVIHKNCMRKLREDRYDASLTFTKDHPKLPEWATVMSESAEITEMLVTAELISAVEQAGDAFEYLLVTDQPLDKPTKIEETVPRKRIFLSLRLPFNTSVDAYNPTLPLFTVFLRLTDRLVNVAHFRQEVARKLRNTRDEEIRRLRRADEEEKAEERKLAAEKVKKEERERLLRGMSAEEQRKYLEKEREREQKRNMKKSTRKG